MTVLVSCTVKKESAPVKSPETTNDSNGAVVLNSKQSQTIQIELGKMELRDLSSKITANGYLDVPPQNKAAINTMITGYVQKLNFLVGDMVQKGDVMAELASMEYVDLQQQYLELMARIVYLEEDYERQKRLRAKDAVSQKTFLSAKVAFRAAETSIKGMSTKLKMLGANMAALQAGTLEELLHLKAPISGSVTKASIVLGQHTDPSETIYEVVNTDHLHLELQVYEKDIGKVKKGQKVWFTIPSIGSEQFRGEVFLVGKDLTSEKRSIGVHVHVPDDIGSFNVGMYANASIEVLEKKAFSVPISALVSDNNRNYIFKKVADGNGPVSFHKVSVKTGMQSGENVQLTDHGSIEPGDEIVINGAYYLLNAVAGQENEE
jgi:cobalt-zinc-cadmium efflux system membrane fusion protein